MKTPTSVLAPSVDVESEMFRSLTRLKASRLAVQHADDLLAVQEGLDALLLQVAELQKENATLKDADHFQAGVEQERELIAAEAKLAEQAAEIERLRETLVRVTNPDGSPNLQAEQVGAAESYRAAAIHAIEQRDAAERAMEEACGLLRESEDAHEAARVSLLNLDQCDEDEMRSRVIQLACYAKTARDRIAAFLAAHGG